MFKSWQISLQLIMIGLPKLVTLDCSIDVALTPVLLMQILDALALKNDGILISTSDRTTRYLLGPLIQEIANVRLRQPMPSPFNHIHFHTHHLAEYDSVWVTLPIL
jgi:hypothetical protein